MKWDNRFLYIFAIAIMACAIYLPGITNSFTYLDDHVQVVENPYIRTLGFNSIMGIFSTLFVGMYQPVTTLSYAAIHSLFGLNSTAFHGLSLLVHILNSFLVFKLMQHFLNAKKTSIFLAILFLTHPMQVESVAWVSAFSNLLFSLFFLAAFWSYIRYKTSGKIKFFALCFSLFLLSCASKSAAVVFPIILFAYDYYLSNKFEIKLLLQKIPFLVISILFGVVTILGRETAGHLSDLTETFNALDRALLVSHSFLFYPIKFLFPYHLSAFYPYPELSNGALPLLYYLSPVLIVGLLVATIRFRKKKLLIFGSVWFVITIALVLQFVPFGNQITADRYIYLPLFGLLLILGSFLQKLKSSKLILLFSIPLIVLSFLSFQRVQIWENDETLWTSVIETHPNVSQAYNNLGSYSLKSNKDEEAFDYFNRAIEIQPNYADAYSNRGNIFAQDGNSEAAVKDFNKAIQLKPHADAYFNRANEYSKLNRLNEAISDYTKSIELDPKVDSYTNRAFTYLKLKNIAFAKRDLKTAQKLNPNYGRAYFLEGIVEQNLGDKPAACAAFLKAANLGEKDAKEAYSQTCR
ncbi:tetratricopeptide repeat protein [Vicingaceae bacterium]|nr:tetratricopeptide repeat protein [Vicingaceae bacterium]MDB4060764.1 tetratricopeptide repeat protein [Vicingaceae bacterium]